MLILLHLSALFYVTYAHCDGKTFIPHPTYCDSYYDCSSGQPVEVTCPDGLLFNPNTGSEQCQYPIDVDCGTRNNQQPPKASKDCPRQFGFFLTSSTIKCNLYINCVHGRAYHMTCPEGLAFNLRTYVCDWPDQVEECNASSYLGFQCPANSYKNFKGKDCSKFIACVDGSPRSLTCPYGTGFDESSGTCSNLAPCIKNISTQLPKRETLS